MQPGRCIRQLNDQESTALRQLYRQTKDADVRPRCQMILLSADDHGVGEIARMTLFDENSVLFWFDRYKAEGLAGLEQLKEHARPGEIVLLFEDLVESRTSSGLRSRS
jgi:hypothetical protein